MLKDVAGPESRREGEKREDGGGALVTIVKPIDLIETGIVAEIDIHQLEGGHRKIIIGLQDIGITLAQDPGM